MYVHVMFSTICWNEHNISYYSFNVSVILKKCPIVWQCFALSKYTDLIGFVYQIKGDVLEQRIIGGLVNSFLQSQSPRNRGFF